MEIQQTPHYAAYIRSLKWVVEKIDGSYVFIKPFPIVGGFAKIQRTKTLPRMEKLVPVLAAHRVRTVAVEPDASVPETALHSWCDHLPRTYRLSTDPFIPTKTLRVSLEPGEQDIFNSFSEAKRRAVRKAAKNGITVEASRDIDALIRIKNASAGFMGFITTSGANNLWKALPDANKSVLLAYTATRELVGGIFLIFWDGIAYYWIAGTVKKGKKLFAPTLLVWEALRTSKRMKCTAFDFVGVWDERAPEKNTEWKGFTKFKEGFGGTPLYYPIATRVA